MSSPRLRLLALAVVLAPGILQGQVNKGWYVQCYDVQNGLPQSSVASLAVDTLGFLWITTEGGLVRFDGSKFSPIRLAPGQDNLTTRTRQLLVTKDHEMYVDDANGDQYVVHGHRVAMLIKEGPYRLQVLGNIPTLDVYTSFLSEPFDKKQAYTRSLTGIRMLAFSPERWMVMRDDQALFHANGVLHRTITFPNNGSLPFLAKGNVVGMHDSRTMYRMDTTAGRLVDVPLLVDGVPGTWPEGAIHFGGTDDSELFVRVGRMLHRCWMDDLGRLNLDPLDLELPEQTRINCVVRVDGTDMIAVGTSSKGLFLYKPAPMSNLKCSILGLEENSYYAQLDLGPLGIMTLGSGRDALLMSPEGCEPIPELAREMSYTSLGLDSDGLAWSCRKDKLVAFSTTHKAMVTTEAMDSKYPVFLAEGDSLLVADQDRFGYIKDLRMYPLAELGGTSFLDRPFLLHRLMNGTLVYGNCRGLFRSTDPHGRSFQLDERSSGMCVRAIVEIDEMVLWGTYGDGVFVELPSGLRKIPLDHGGAMNHVHAFLRDGNDHLWMSTNKGFVRTTLADIRTFLSDSTQRPYYATYGANSGMSNPELNGGCQPAYVRLADGTVSFPSLDGLVQFIPENIPDPFPSNPFLIGLISVNGVPWPMDKYSIFPSSTKQVSIELAMAYWGERSNAQLEYRISGINEEWAILDYEKGYFTIDRPPPGEHTVYIRTVGAAARGVASEPFYWFKVEAPFWLTWKGYLLMLLVLGAITSAIWHRYATRLRRKNMWLEENVRARTLELDSRNEQLTNAVETRESLIAIISHDIITPLRFIARVARSTRQMARSGMARDELDSSLGDLSSSAEKLKANATALMDWVKFNPDHITARMQPVDLGSAINETVQLWAEIADRNGIVARTTLPEHCMVTSDPHLLKVILSNLLGNAITHTGRGNAISIDLKRTASHWELAVGDTGPGIDAETMQRLTVMLSAQDLGNTARFARGDGQGIGYVIVASMAKILGAQISLTTTPKGTVVTLIHPEVDPRGGPPPGAPIPVR